ncbi:MAG: prepilin-type N-terminal cleavage/methylation domain-containing protein [Kiritimatiellae bacterium]|nr:prepilin-type N-terminal cleavage/methylation domain-containing protein [Kiritimatiellia bacterium]
MNKARNGFTIIEMMIVLIIIAILAGFVFRMMTLAGQKNDIAATKAKLEKISNALEAYRAEYGSYPPVAIYRGKQPTFYEIPVGGENSDMGYITPEMAARMQNISMRDGNKWNEFPLFTFGLASYFYPRYWGIAENRVPKEFFGDLDAEDIIKNKDNGADAERVINQWKDHNNRKTGKDGKKIQITDINKDMNVVKKILPMLDTGISFKMENGKKKWVMHKHDDGNPNYGVGNWEWNGSAEFQKVDALEREFESFEYLTQGVSLKDAWGNHLHYQSNPPYDSYRIWSVGVNGNTCDPTCENPSTCRNCSDDLVAGQQ